MVRIGRCYATMERTAAPCVLRKNGLISSGIVFFGLVHLVVDAVYERLPACLDNIM